MHLTGSYRIAAPRQKVWEGLNDVDILKQCIPGCEEVDQTSPTEFTAKVMAKVGPVKARFSGAVTLSDLDPPQAYTITGEGKGGAAGFGKGSARVTLVEEGAETVLSYDAQASVGGKLAQIGARLVEGSAKKYADDFFGRFSQIVAGEPAPAGDNAAEAEPEAAAPVLAPEAQPAPSPAPERLPEPAPDPVAAPEPAAEPAPEPLPEAPQPVSPTAPSPEPVAAQAAAIEPKATAPQAEAPVKDETPQGGIPPAVWIAGVIVLIVAALLIFA